MAVQILAFAIGFTGVAVTAVAAEQQRGLAREPAI
jgi:hypothetical protein